jgi:hypothetical protein
MMVLYGTAGGYLLGVVPCLTGPSSPCLSPALLTSMQGKPAATSSVSCRRHNIPKTV